MEHLVNCSLYTQDETQLEQYSLYLQIYWLFSLKLNLFCVTIIIILSLWFYSGTSNLKQSLSVDVRTGSTPNTTPRTSLADTEGKSFLSNQAHVTGVQDVLTRMKNADQGETPVMIYITCVFILTITV